MTIAIVTLLLATCGSATVELDGSHWVLIELDGEPVAAQAEQALTLNFEDGQVSGYSGCNQFGGEYEADAASGSLQITALFSTLMACLDDDLMAREGAYQGALQAAESYEVMNGTLMIVYPQGILLFEAMAGSN